MIGSLHHFADPANSNAHKKYHVRLQDFNFSFCLKRSVKDDDDFSDSYKLLFSPFSASETFFLSFSMRRKNSENHTDLKKN